MDIFVQLFKTGLKLYSHNRIKNQRFHHQTDPKVVFSDFKFRH